MDAVASTGISSKDLKKAMKKSKAQVTEDADNRRAKNDMAASEDDELAKKTAKQEAKRARKEAK